MRLFSEMIANPSLPLAAPLPHVREHAGGVGNGVEVATCVSGRCEMRYVVIFGVAAINQSIACFDIATECIDEGCNAKTRLASLSTEDACIIDIIEGGKQRKVEVRNIKGC